MSKSQKLEDIVRRLYLDILHREPDKDGFNHYLNLLKNNEIDELKLIEIFKESSEYKLSHPIEYDSNEISISDRMKKDWNERTKFDLLFVIAYGNLKNENKFWKSGEYDCNNILGIDSSRYPKIIHNNKPENMKILEIGCGIGRILIPMSKIFGDVVGIDVSSEMVSLSQKYIANIENCTILENDGTDLALFSDNCFDFCYSFIVFQHIPDKNIIKNYIQEVSRILKPGCLFRFQIRGIIDSKPKEITTWDGVQFNSDEIHEIAQNNDFEIIEEGNDKDEYYWLTFKSAK